MACNIPVLYVAFMSTPLPLDKSLGRVEKFIKIYVILLILQVFDTGWLLKQKKNRHTQSVWYWDSLTCPVGMTELHEAWCLTLLPAFGMATFLTYHLVTWEFSLGLHYKKCRRRWKQWYLLYINFEIFNYHQFFVPSGQFPLPCPV